MKENLFSIVLDFSNDLSTKQAVEYVKNIEEKFEYKSVALRNDGGVRANLFGSLSEKDSHSPFQPFLMRQHKYLGSALISYSANQVVYRSSI